jgi:hypothetical protein
MDVHKDVIAVASVAQDRCESPRELMKFLGLMPSDYAPASNAARDGGSISARVKDDKEFSHTLVPG